jgi:Zn-dependent protease
VAGCASRAARFMSFNPADFALFVVPFLMAVVFHEWAHGFVAKQLGDDTASMAGRLTLNPVAHIDPVGTIALPAFLMMAGAPIFGWAKPVPIAFHQLRHPRRDMILVAIAGPAMNLGLALLSAAAYAAILPLAMPSWGDTSGFRIAEPLVRMCQASVAMNVVLAVFNMLPIPPLDGGRVAVGMLPPSMAYNLARVEPYGFLIVIALLATHMLDGIVGPPIRGILYLLQELFR